MIISTLWEKLNPNQQTEDTLIRDLREGKVPNLPYFIIDQDNAKNSIGASISSIDGTRMQTNLIIAQYGNGKTNILKYLQLFFQSNKLNIDLIYSRADVEQPDIVIFLLRIIQDTLIDQLVAYIKNIRNNKNISEHVSNNFSDNFASIREYVRKLFTIGNTDDEIKKLVYLGTGRLYTKGSFKEFDLQQLTDFNRREILVTFLNIFSENKHYLIFGIDEIEKIQEKSRLRLNQFLTSYRELIDLFNKINGHYLITCFTDATGSFEIQSANEALYTRIKHNIINLNPISKPEDIGLLLTYLNDLFKTKRDAKKLKQILSQVKKQRPQRNRDLMQLCATLLFESEEKFNLQNWLIDNPNIKDLFDELKEKYEIDGVLKSLNQKLFDPLEYYLEDNYLIDDPSQINRRDSQSFVDYIGKKVHHFIFNENIELDSLTNRLNMLANDYQMDLIIYAPDKLDLSNGEIALSPNELTFTIVDYSPVDFFILLNLYRENYDIRDKLKEAITKYSENNL